MAGDNSNNTSTAARDGLEEELREREAQFNRVTRTFAHRPQRARLARYMNTTYRTDRQLLAGLQVPAVDSCKLLDAVLRGGCAPKMSLETLAEQVRSGRPQGFIYSVIYLLLFIVI